jgi:hypothetical protein
MRIIEPLNHTKLERNYDDQIRTTHKRTYICPKTGFDGNMMGRHDWHETILNDRKAAFKAGKITASDWAEAKERIKKKVS